MTTAELRNLFDEARPLVKQWLGLSEQFSAFRVAATDKGFDWSQIKALLKAQAQDERDGGNEHVKHIIERAEYASSYAAQLGLLNENNYSDEPIEIPAAPVKAAAEESSGESRERQTVETRETKPPAASKPEAPAVEWPHDRLPSQTAAANTAWQMDEDVPAYLRRVG